MRRDGKRLAGQLCGAETWSGRRCRNWPLKGEWNCFWHSSRDGALLRRADAVRDSVATRRRNRVARREAAQGARLI